MSTLGLNNFNIVCSTLGGFIALFGLVSFLAKDKFYLSEALLSLLAGVIFGPALNWIRPKEYAFNDEVNLEYINLYFCRIVLGVQLVIAGIQLPPKYLKKEWKSLAYLISPGMTVMWLITAMLVWAMVPSLNFLSALAIGACVTPTDPILSNSIVKGKFADKHIPRQLQRIVIAESGVNDGLGYPFLFLPLYLITYIGQGAHGHTVGKAVGMWFYETWCYQIFLSCAYGLACGWVAKELLHWAEERKYVDRESFLVFALALAIFVVGTDGLLGSDDVLACFVAGNAFTWDDWFRVETADDSLQPTIDMLLNVAVFIWFGAVCTWHKFAHNDVIPIYRLIPLGILVLLLRRPPIIALMHTRIHQIEQWRQAAVVGFFGPIGVSAIFYLYVSQEYLRTSVLDDSGNQREDAARLAEIMMVVIWFLVVCSIVVHGLTIPLVKLGLKIPRTLSEAVSQGENVEDEPVPRFHARENAEQIGPPKGKSIGASLPANPVSSPMFRIGRHLVRDSSSSWKSARLETSPQRSFTHTRAQPQQTGDVPPSDGPSEERLSSFHMPEPQGQPQSQSGIESSAHTSAGSGPIRFENKQPLQSVGSASNV